MVFDNDPSLSTEFFQNLLFKHLSQFDLEDEEKPTNAVNMRTRIFNKKETFEELVRASEGVPRDAINLLAKASRKAKSAKVNISNVRAAALEWFQQDKSSFLSANRDADIFLRWLMEKVIGERQARAFLISVDDRLRAIDTLYDQRLLHILKRSVSSKDEPGKRFIVYKLDYGCYVNLKDTNKNPKGLLADVDDAGNEIFIEVPKDDYRSIRRTIVNVSEFNIERMQKIIEETEIKLGEFSAHLFMDVSISRMLRQTKELFGDTRSNTKSSKGHQLDLFHTRDE